MPVLLDCAQVMAHIPLDVKALDVDFLAFSGHKMFGPTGIGVLYGKEKWLEKMPPLFGGGDMIDQVTLSKTTYAGLPHKFEAGTPSYCRGAWFRRRYPVPPVHWFCSHPGAGTRTFGLRHRLLTGD